MVKFYTNQEGAEAAAEYLEPERRNTIKLPGIDAMRWVISMPANIDYLVCDYYPNTEDWFTFPCWWLRLPLFPLFHTIERLPSPSDLNAILKIPGDRSAHPDVMSTIIHIWPTLSTIFAGDGKSVPVEDHGKKYFCLFSDPARGEKVIKNNKNLTLKRIPAELTIAQLLSKVATIEGVWLDPGSEGALRLDQAALLAMSIWSESPEQRLTQTRYFDRLTGVCGRTTFSAEALGAMVSAFPDWWKLVWVAPEGSYPPVTSPDNGSILLFSEETLAGEWIRTVDKQKLSCSYETASGLFLSRWRSSVFEAAWREGRSVTINPRPDSQGLLLGTEALKVITRRLDEVFEPRHPGFRA
jgi:hypothetical protein